MNLDRRFGVELEFDSNGLGSNGVVRILRDAFDKRGLQRWHFRDRLDYDGSELELKTPILRGSDGFTKLKVVMDTLSDHGCYATSADGMHVHHDAPEFVNNINNCIKLVKSWKRNRHLIYRFVSPDRFESDYYGKSNENVYWACPEWSDEEIRKMEEDMAIPHWNRHDINLCSLPYKGSIELRLHQGTLDFDEAASWIQFGQKFIDRVLAHNMMDSETPEKLLKKVRVSPDAEKVLLDKAKYGVRI